MTPWPPDLGVRTVDHYIVRARLLRADARNGFIFSLLSAIGRLAGALAGGLTAQPFNFRRPWRR